MVILKGYLDKEVLRALPWRVTVVGYAFKIEFTADFICENLNVYVQAMAYCMDVCTLLVSNIPTNFATSKLKIKLDEVGGKGSVVDVKRIDGNSVHLDVYGVEAQQRLLNHQTHIKFGGKTFLLNIKKLREDSSSGSEDEHDDNYSYDAADTSTKAILRYLSKTDSHKNTLTREVMKQFQAISIDVSPESIFIKLPEDRGYDTKPRLDEYIKKFVAKYASWTEKLEDVTPANVKHIKSVLPKYQKKCFASWYDDSSTVLVTGPKALVEEAEDSIKEHLETQQKHVPANSRAESFEYDKIPPAVMRFVSRQKLLKQELSILLGDFGHAEITEKNKNLCVKITPKQKAIYWLHADFQQSCEKQLEIFFDRFTTWKGKFDPVVLDRHRKQSPSSFKTQTFPNCFVQWHFDSNVVDITGAREDVNYHRNLFESMLGLSTSSSPRCQLSAEPLSLGSHSSAHHRSASVPLNNARSRKLSYSSDEATFVASSERYQYDSDNTPAAILKFVQHDAAARRELERLHRNQARINIKTDRGQVQIHVTPMKKNFTRSKIEMIDNTISDYLEKFDTQTKKCENSKLEVIQKIMPDMLKQSNGLFIQTFPGSIKITGQKELVTKKCEEVEYEINCEIKEEKLPSDIFVIQRECGVWKSVEDACKQKGVKISISSSDDCKITYKGLQKSIVTAQKCLGDISESLVYHQVKGLSKEQLDFLRKCAVSQKNISEEKNLLECLYRKFKNSGFGGSLLFQPSSIRGEQEEVLLCTTSDKNWQRGNQIMKQFIIEYEINSAQIQPNVSYGKFYSGLKKRMENSPVYLKEKRDTREIRLYCFRTDLSEIQQQVERFNSEIASMEEVKKFYPMSEDIVQHICNQLMACKIEKAKTVIASVKGGKHGLLVAYDDEDRDTVEMRLEDLQQEICKLVKHLDGFSLYEYLTNEGKESLSYIEHQTNCSIVLKAIGKVKAKGFVSVKVGDILDERCDAIVKSTGRDMNLSGQVSQALVRKYGKNIVSHCNQNGQWLIPSKLCACTTDQYMPWKYIFNLATKSDGSGLKNDVLNLLRHADHMQVASLALPTIATGNIGLNPQIVAQYMKEAFDEAAEMSFTYLKDVRLIIFEDTLLPFFTHIAPTKANKSTGANATIYGNSEDKLKQAENKLKEFCDLRIKTTIIRDASSAFVKSRISDICERHDVLAEWKQSILLLEECHLSGIADKVKKAEDDVKKLLGADFPSTWTQMPLGQNMVRKKLYSASAEYQAVEKKFRESSPSYTKITRIERIQNEKLYKSFKVLKDMRTKEGSAQVITRNLFHGTVSGKIETICNNNFDRNFAGENGTAYGRGSYFAVESRYSARYCKDLGDKYIFLAEVITGDYTQGSSNYKAPPEKYSSGALYDSCVDNVINPNIFVVFNDSSAYPSHLITFQ